MSFPHCRRFSQKMESRKEKKTFCEEIFCCYLSVFLFFSSFVVLRNASRVKQELSRSVHLLNMGPENYLKALGVYLLIPLSDWT